MGSKRPAQGQNLFTILTLLSLYNIIILTYAFISLDSACTRKKRNLIDNKWELDCFQFGRKEKVKTEFSNSKILVLNLYGSRAGHPALASERCR